MKLRILADSIRFRLGKGEVDRFLREASIEETAHFPSPNGSRLVYELRASAEGNSITCQFVDGRLTVSIPRETVQQWAVGSEISIRGLLPVDERGTSRLKILIEKDFACIDGSTDESQEDAFPNPKAIEPV